MAATNALDHQADIAEVQEWLGHRNTAIRIYDHHWLGWRIARCFADASRANLMSKLMRPISKLLGKTLE
jgi:integrase